MDDEFEVVDRALIVDEPADVAGEEVLPGSDAVDVELAVGPAETSDSPGDPYQSAGA
ncbi:MAG: hypothetical protein H7323_08790 [Frankiales bacterium]|nr:hypothetical protein [Frankiales bacterium]